MGKPKPEDPKYKVFYDKIIAAAKGGPVDLEGADARDPKERGWLLDWKLHYGLLTAIPYDKDESKNPRSLQDVPIGGTRGGWLDAKAKPVLVKAFNSEACDLDKGTTLGKNCTGILTYQGCYILWRHAIHYHLGNNPQRTGAKDAIEGYKLTGDIASQYVKAKMK